MIRGTQQTGNAPGVQPQFANTQPSNAQQVSWRVATDRKTQISRTDTYALGAVGQPVSWPLDGTGFLEAIDIDVNVVGANGGGAAVAFNPDAIWNVLTNITLKANGPEIFNLSGFDCHLWDLYGGFGILDPAGSVDPLVYAAIVGAGATGGSFRAKFRLPLSINGRSLIGAVGNQDRSTKYELRTDLADLATIYATAPSAGATATITRTLLYSTVPASVNANGQQQQILPPWYGVFHYANVLTSEAQPSTLSTQNHFVRGLGNTFRVLILEFYDSLGARSDLLMPNNIQFKIGQDAWFSETADERRFEMFKRYGFDAPAGVLVYDWLDDFGAWVGSEYGNDWMNTAKVSEAQFQLAYPVFVNTPGQLRIIQDSLAIPAGMNLLQYT